MWYIVWCDGVIIHQGIMFKISLRLDPVALEGVYSHFLDEFWDLTAQTLPVVCIRRCEVYNEGNEVNTDQIIQ